MVGGVNDVVLALEGAGKVLLASLPLGAGLPVVLVAGGGWPLDVPDPDQDHPRA